MGRGDSVAWRLDGDGHWRRPRQTSVEPRAFEEGAVALQATAYQPEPTREDALRLVIDRMVERLQEPDRSSVRMAVMEGLPYAEAGRLLAADLGRTEQVGARTVWRWAQRGLNTVKGWLSDAPWASELLDGRIPPGEVTSLPGASQPELAEGGPAGSGGFDAALARQFNRDNGDEA